MTKFPTASISNIQHGYLNDILSRITAVKARDQDNPKSMRCHALPQLTFPLSTLQLQPLNCILQSLLLLDHPSQLHRLRSIPRNSTPKRSATLTAIRLAGFIGRESPFLELTFGLQALFATGESLHVVGGEGEEVRDAGCDFVEKGFLSFTDGGLGEEFKVL